MIGYHSTDGYKLFDPLNMQVVINRDVIIDELKEWDWNENIKKDSVRILCDKPTSETDNGIRPEGDGVQAGTSKHQRTRNIPERL